MIIGGTRKTGRRVAKRLRERGRSVRIVSRSGQPPFDWEDQATWAPTLRNMESAYVTYYPDLAFPGGAALVDLLSKIAVDAGVRHLVLLSGRNEEGALRGEQAVQDSGADWTIVRSSFMNQNFSESFWLDSVLAGEIAVPGGNVAEPFIDVDDIADVVVAALTDDRHVGQLYEVTGPRLLTFADAAAEIAKATGREVSYIPVSPEQFHPGMIKDGVPPDFARALTDLFSEVLDGRSAYLTDGVERAIGRRPRDFADYARDTAATGVWDR